MNIQTRKLTLIEWLIGLQDEMLLGKLEGLRTKTKKSKPTEIQPMSLDTFYSKIELSDKALKNGDTITQEDLRKEIKLWRKK